MTVIDPVALTIGEASAETGIGMHALRYYERAGLLVIPRNGNGQRRYGADEVSAVRFVAQLRRTGMPISVIRSYAEMVRAGTVTTELSLQLLEDHRDAVMANLAEQQDHLDAINRKIAAYRAALVEGARTP